MTVIVLTACPAGLRGHLTQWLLEIAAGVYVGHISKRVRQRLWARVVEMAGPGRALMVFQVAGEQRLSFVAHDHQWEPVDVDGITLMRRPTTTITRNPALPAGPSTGSSTGSVTGWSKAAKRRRFGPKARRAGADRTGGDNK